MVQRMKHAVQILLVSILLLSLAVPGFAAEVRRVPSKASVEQGFLALTLDAEGAEDFRYTGLENKMHVYRGTIKPESKLKFIIRATLADQKSLPITSRSCIIRMQVVAKKGGEVIKTQNFSKENKSNVFVNYIVPQGADTLEVTETFVLSNKSKEQKFNQRVTSQNKLLLTTAAAGAGVAAGKTEKGVDKKANADSKNNTKNGGADKNAAAKDSDKKNKSDNGKADVSGNVTESKGMSKGMMAGAAIAVAAIAGGGFFFMKKRKEEQAITEAIAKKERLRQQAIRKQQEMQQDMQNRQAEIIQQDSLAQEERMSEPEQTQQQAMQRDAEQQRLMQEQNTSPQNANMAIAAGAAGAMGSVQNDALGNTLDNMPDSSPHFCENCGTPLKPGSKFCENCGARV